MKKDMSIAPGYIPDIIRTMYKINKETKNHYQFLAIMDDIQGAKQDKEMTRLLCLYRNSNISAIVSGQDMMMLNSTGRANVNYVCLFWQNTPNRVEDNIKNFLRGYFPRNLSMDEKIELYQQLTKDHHFLFIDNLENTICRCKLKPSQMVD
jgi:hypothetical protein